MVTVRCRVRVSVRVIVIAETKLTTIMTKITLMPLFRVQPPGAAPSQYKNTSVCWFRTGKGPVLLRLLQD